MLRAETLEQLSFAFLRSQTPLEWFNVHMICSEFLNCKEHTILVDVLVHRHCAYQYYPYACQKNAQLTQNALQRIDRFCARDRIINKRGRTDQGFVLISGRSAPYVMRRIVSGSKMAVYMRLCAHAGLHRATHRGRDALMGNHILFIPIVTTYRTHIP